MLLTMKYQLLLDRVELVFGRRQPDWLLQDLALKYEAHDRIQTGLVLHWPVTYLIVL